MKVALFGGSFDPPHIGHIEIVKKLKELGFLDKIIVMPTYLNPFKSSSLADAPTRLKWLREIFKDDKKVEVSDFEVKQNQKTPSIITVDKLLDTCDEIFLVIGADNLASLNKWHRFDELKQKVTFIVATRDEIKVPKEFIKLDIKQNISSSSLRKEIKKEYLPKEVAEKIYSYYKEKNEQ
jgi:nicotinate-nucleotide adenylyltransferase